MSEVNLDTLLNVDVVRKRKPHPKGWTPGITLGAREGSIITEPLPEAPQDWSEILTELLPNGFDPNDYQVDGDTVEVRAWDSNVGEGNIERLYYFKARIRRKSLDVSIDLDDIIAAAKKHKKKTPPVVTDNRTYCLQITDLQAGQGDGDGVEGLTSRALDIPRIVSDDLKMLKKAGKPVENIFVAITGDLVEGINGWYEMQTFSVELDRRDQVKLVRRLLTEILLGVASHGLPVHVATVPGNHGENRNNGKAFTTLNDNDDVAVVEQIAESFAIGKIDNVTFAFPARDRLSLTVDIQGHVVGLTHGHVARAGGQPAAKILAWFKSMAASRDPIGESELLVTGHYHHLILQQLIGDTWLLQGGALCDASAWFSQTAGLVSDPLLNKWTMTPAQVVEVLLPTSWDRSKLAVAEIG